MTNVISALSSNFVNILFLAIVGSFAVCLALAGIFCLGLHLYRCLTSDRARNACGDLIDRSVRRGHGDFCPKLALVFASDEFILRRYAIAGLRFGRLSGLAEMMAHDSQDAHLTGHEDFLVWDFWERECLQRGYRTLPLRDFQEAAICGVDITQKLGHRSDAHQYDGHARAYAFGCWCDSVSGNDCICGERRAWLEYLRRNRTI